MGEIVVLVVLFVLSFIYNNFIVKEKTDANHEQDLSDWLPEEEATSQKTEPQVLTTPPPPQAPVQEHHNRVELTPQNSSFKDAYIIKDREISKVHVSRKDFKKRNTLKKALIMNTVLAKPKAFDRS